MDLFIIGSFIVTPYKVIKDGAILIEGTDIVDVGKARDLKSKYSTRGYEVINATNKAIIPGLINTHTHASMSLLRGVADDAELMDWLNNKIWPIEAKLTPEDIHVGALLSIIEMLKSGTTTFNDMYFEMEEVAKAVEITGIRAVLSRGLIGLGNEINEKKSFKEGLTFALKYQDAADGRIKTMLGPHAPYTCSAEYLTDVVNVAKEHNLPIHIHIAETKQEKKAIEDAFSINLDNKGIIEYLDSFGFFQVPVVAAHMVWVDERQYRILKEHDVGIAHNPISNMKLASGIAPVPSMLEYGLYIGIGTDGPASNNSLDMFREMKATALIHKVNTLNPTVVPALEVLKMGTIYGAHVLRLDHMIGSIEPRKKADLVILDLQKAHLSPLHNIVSSLIYSATGCDVEKVIINGNIVVNDGRVTTVNEQEVLKKAEEHAKALLERANVTVD